MSHGAQQCLLRLEIEIFENIRREPRWQDAKDDHLFVFRQIEDDFGDIGGWPFTKEFTQRAEIAGLDHAPDLWF